MEITVNGWDFIFFAQKHQTATRSRPSPFTPAAWCRWGEENQKGKTTEVAEGESKIKELTSQVEELNASAACLGCID